MAVPKSDLKQWLRGPFWYLKGRYKRLQFDHWAAIHDMCQRSDAVVCVTKEQKASIFPSCKNVHIILDIHDSVVRGGKYDYRCGEVFKLVWEGLSSNIPQLMHIRDVLNELHRERPLQLNIITDPDASRFLGGFGRVKSINVALKAFHSVRLYPWDDTQWANAVSDSDLAVIPLDQSDAFVMGKPENKLLLFWRMGMPVVTTPTPAYKRAMSEAGIFGLTCGTKDEWLNALRVMASSELARKAVGDKGRLFSEMRYSRKQLLSQWDAVFSSVGFNF